MNNIGESGARIISESLKTNTTLTDLLLNGVEKRSKMNDECFSRYFLKKSF